MLYSNAFRKNFFMTSLSCVFHVSNFVTGTSNVINSCIQNNVSRVVFTSTIDVVLGHHAIVNGNESTPVPKEHLFPGYNETKSKAESMVKAANGRPLARG